MITLETPPQSSLDDLFQIQCGSCGQRSPALDWTSTPTSGDLPDGEYQCPKCSYAFRRVKNTQPYGPGYKLPRIAPKL